MLAQHLARVPVHRALIRTLEHRLFAGETLERPILDIGCGDGHYAAAAFPGGLDVGLDITHEIVAEGRRNGPYGHADVADGTRLPYADAAFRTVVSNCVIEHIPDIEGLVREVARVLTPGGRFLFDVPSEHFTASLFTVSLLRRLGLVRLAAGYGRWWNGRAAHFHLDAPAVWRERLARHGLTADRHVYYMSPAATHVFELSHYYAIPSLAWRRLTGRWSLRPDQARASLAHRWLRPYAEEDWPAVGACSFFVAHK
jgi:SAM-dependent methyltransferase